MAGAFRVENRTTRVPLPTWGSNLRSSWISIRISATSSTTRVRILRQLSFWHTVRKYSTVRNQDLDFLPETGRIPNEPHELGVIKNSNRFSGLTTPFRQKIGFRGKDRKEFSGMRTGRQYHTPTRTSQLQSRVIGPFLSYLLLVLGIPPGTTR
eukprot:3669234-Rhodomonas_salina.2